MINRRVQFTVPRFIFTDRQPAKIKPRVRSTMSARCCVLHSNMNSLNLKVVRYLRNKPVSSLKVQKKLNFIVKIILDSVAVIVYKQHFDRYLPWIFVTTSTCHIGYTKLIATARVERVTVLKMALF